MHKQHLNVSLVDWSVFSMIIEKRRIHLGLSQLELASHISIPLEDIEKAEKGKAISPSIYSALCAWYGVPHEWFYKDILCEKRRALS